MGDDQERNGAPAGIRTPNQQIMRRFEGHQQGETKRDEAIFTESAAVKVRYIFVRLHAIAPLVGLRSFTKGRILQNGK
jgi:hypothetical protein